MTQPTEYEQVTYNSDDGAQVARTSTDKIGFWGATPVAQQAVATATQTTVTTTGATSTTPFGYTTSTQANDIITQLNAAKVDIAAIKTALSTSGLVR